MNLNLKSLVLILFCLLVSLSRADDTGHLCVNPSAMEITDRGNLTDSPCVVPNKKFLLEGGYQHLKLRPTGVLQIAPQVQVGYGLPQETEFFVTIPTYFHLNNPLAKGFGSAGLGLKRQLFYGTKWIISGEAILEPPSGGANYGNSKTGGILNAMGSYKINNLFSIAAMLGVSSLTLPHNLGGGRYTSFNPSAVLSFLPHENLTIFVEASGATQTSVTTGGSLIGDIGLLYLVNHALVFDIEAAQRIIGPLGFIQNYIGGGATLIF